MEQRPLAEGPKVAERLTRGGWASVIVTIALFLCQGVVLVVLFFFVLNTAYTYEHVSSVDEMYKLGSGPRNAVGYAGLLAFIGGIAGVALLFNVCTRYWAWLAPIVSIVGSVASCLYFVSTFHAAAPEFGG